MDILPNTIDSSARSDFASCPHLYWERHILGLQPRAPAIHLIFGSALAAGLAAARTRFYLDGWPREAAEGYGLWALIVDWGDRITDIGEAGTLSERNKTLDRCASVYVQYLDTYPLGEDTFTPRPLNQPSGRTGIECPFAIPIPGIEHPTGGPWYFTGRMDMFGDMAAPGGDMVRLVEDDKTGSSEKNWTEQWDMRAQFPGYLWAAHQLGLPAEGVLVRGVIVYKNSTEFPHVIKTYPRWRIDEWLDVLRHDIKRIEECWQTGYWSKVWGSACMAYFRPCDYMPLCLAQDEAPWREAGYRVEFWDPLRND